MIMAIYRHIDIRKFIKIEISTETIIGTIFAFVISFCAYYLRNIVFNIIIFIVIIIYFLYINRNILKVIIDRIKIKTNNTENKTQNT